jgi:hypothetical protein
MGTETKQGVGIHRRSPLSFWDPIVLRCQISVDPSFQDYLRNGELCDLEEGTSGAKAPQPVESLVARLKSGPPQARRGYIVGVPLRDSRPTMRLPRVVRVGQLLLDFGAALYGRA